MKIIVANEEEQEAVFMVINRIMELLDGATASKSDLIQPASVEEYIVANELDSAQIEINEDGEKPLVERFENLKKEWEEYWF